MDAFSGSWTCGARCWGCGGSAQLPREVPSAHGRVQGMSGRHAMAVRLTDGLADHCDEHLSDVCLAFAETLVRMAGGVIAGIKPSAIFSIPMRAYCVGRWRQLQRQALDEALRAYARVLPSYGVSLAVLYRNDRRVYLMIWRPDMVRQRLRTPGAAAILREEVYGQAPADELVVELRRGSLLLLAAREVRRVPARDRRVSGLSARGCARLYGWEEATCIGPWHAYGDERVAQRRFDALGEAGASLSQALCAGRDARCALLHERRRMSLATELAQGNAGQNLSKEDMT